MLSCLPKIGNAGEFLKVNDMNTKTDKRSGATPGADTYLPKTQTQLVPDDINGSSLPDANETTSQRHIREALVRINPDIDSMGSRG